MIASRLALLAAAMIAATPALADDITIGFTVSQTGPLNNDSVSQMRGFELWRTKPAAAHAGGKQYKINFCDDASQNVRVQQLYTRLIAQDKAQFLFSPYSRLVATAAIISSIRQGLLTTGGAEEKPTSWATRLFQVYSPASYLAVHSRSRRRT